HLGLGRLIAVYDDNHITIDGPTELALSDDACGRFRAYGWHVLELGEVANDLGALEAGIREAMAEPARPSLVVLRSHIGWPSPKWTDTAKAHGNPFSEDDIREVKSLLDLPPEEHFFVPDEVLAFYREAGTRGAPLVAEWRERLSVLRTQDPGLVDDFDSCLASAAPAASSPTTAGARCGSRR